MEQQQWSPDLMQSPVPWICVANDGGIKRGDRSETGDERARPNKPASRDPLDDGDVSNLTGQLPDTPDETDVEAPEVLPDSDDASIMDADDPRLGLTNVGSVPPDDWAADTGPTKTAESEQ